MILQEFVERSCSMNELGKRIVFLGFTHLSLTEYGSRAGLNENERNRLATVSDRFRKPSIFIRLSVTEVEGYHLVGGMLHRTPAGIALFDNPIMETLVKGIRIQGLDGAPQLKDSVEAIIVQSFSDNWINNTSGKIHTLVIGAPGVGKKLLTEAAKCLNPAFQEAHPSKATAAGVCSTALTMHGSWISKPGYLPLAHRGVFAIQDFHAVKVRRVKSCSVSSTWQWRTA